MGIKRAEIPVKTLRKFRQRSIDVQDTATGAVSNRIYNEIGGALLIPVADAHLFGENRSNLSRYFLEGKLTPYLKNGTVKTDNSKSRVYYDLHEWLGMDENENY